MSQQTIVLAGGCFWGLEELFRTQPGVVDTEVGYAGGTNTDPTYEHHPGHAEALEITYDDTVTSQVALFDYFFRIHDPTTKNRQGNDVGSSYRSAIFYQNDAQLVAARQAITITDASHLYPHPVITSLEPLTAFHPAEAYHQDYLQKHPGGYTYHFERTAVPLAQGGK